MRCDWCNNYLRARGLWAASRTPRILALDVLACACIHQDYVPYAGCTGMPPCIHQDCIRHHLKFRPSVPGCFTRYEKLMQRIWESNFNSTWVVGCIPRPTDFNTGRTGMRLHTPGLRPRCAGCTGMRHAYTRTASRHHWMHWHALAYTRTASAHFFFKRCFFFAQTCVRAAPHLTTDALACPCIHQDCIPATLDALACASIHQDCIQPPLDALVCVTHTPVLHPHTTLREFFFLSF